MTSRWIVGGVLAVVFAAGVAAGARQQQAATRREPQFENADVQVWKSIIMPNQPLALHRHDFGRTIVALKGGALDIVNAKGETVKTMTWETGKAIGWTKIRRASSTATSTAGRSPSRSSSCSSGGEGYGRPSRWRIEVRPPAGLAGMHTGEPFCIPVRNL